MLNLDSCTSFSYLNQETVVIDTSGEWLASFKDRHSNMQTQCLRSPVTWSPHPSPTSMQAYADSRGRSKVLTLIVTCLEVL